MADKPWKRFERQVNKFFNGGGRSRAFHNWMKHGSDIMHDILHVQCKYKKRDTLVGVWKDAKKASDGKIPVVCIKTHGDNGFFVFCHSTDLTAIANQRTITITETGG